MSISAPDYQVTETNDGARELCAQLLAEAKPAGVDIETGYDGEFREDAQKHPEEGFIVSLQLTNSNHWARLLPLRFDSYANLDNHEVAEALWPVARAGLLTAWNASFEARFMSRWFTRYLGEHPEFGPQVLASHYGNPAFPGYFPFLSDPMLEAHAEGEYRSLKLKENTRITYGYEMMEISELFALANHGKALTQSEMKGIRCNTLDLAGEHRAAIVKYGCDDAVLELCHHHRRYPKVKDSLIYRIEMGILPIACEMMDEGLLLDWPFMREGALKARLFQDKMQVEIQDDLTAMLAAKGVEEPCRINLRSSQQLVRVLYEQLELPVHRRTPRRRNKKGEMTGGTPSTDADIALAPLAKEFPVVQRIIDYKSLDKLAGTYLEKYERNYTYCPCGRTHPNWMQAGVPAGRWACSAWPVQQAPKLYHYELRSGETFDHNFRDSVKAPEDWYFLGYDYAQIERRVLAGEAGDPVLLEAFRSGVDIHKRTAADLLGKPIEDITKDERQKMGKTLGFAMDYGLSIESLADRMAIPVAQANGLHERYFEVYSCLKPWSSRTIAQAKRDGFVLTGGFKRKVTIWEFQSADRRTYAEGERLAGNAPIQGAAADYMKLATIRVKDALRRSGLEDRVRIVMNMHDALGFYVHQSLAPLDVIRVLQPAVVWTAPFIAHWPPMKAEWHMGTRWGSVIEAKLELDAAGVPVGLELEKPKPKIVEAVDVTPVPDTGLGQRAALSPEPARGSAGTAGDGGGRGGGEPFGSPGAGRVIVTVAEMPPVQPVRDLIEALGHRDGGVTAVLRTPQGDLELARECALVPAQHPEVTLLLGMTAAITCEAPQLVTQA